MSERGTLAVVEEGEEFALLGSADGTLFVLRCKADSLTARLGGEDGIRFRNDYDVIKAQQPGWQADQTLAQLWDQGGYSWLAQPEGDGDGDIGVG